MTRYNDPTALAPSTILRAARSLLVKRPEYAELASLIHLIVHKEWDDWAADNEPRQKGLMETIAYFGGYNHTPGLANSIHGEVLLLAGLDKFDIPASLSVPPSVARRAVL